MTDSLLRTKLHRPAPASAVIVCARLLDRLQEGLDSRATLVSAAAGSGKSTLLNRLHNLGLTLLSVEMKHAQPA